MDNLEFNEKVAKDLAAKLNGLQKHLHRKFNGYLLPESIDKANSIAEIVEIIAKHLDIEKRVVYSVATLNSRGGEYREDASTIYIILDSNIIKSNQILGLVICHELMHHYLIENNIRLSETIENERLTDVSMFYMGLGLIVLNGAIFNETIVYGRNTIGTLTNSIGYMDLNCYLFLQTLMQYAYPDNTYSQYFDSIGIFHDKYEIKKKLKHFAKNNVYRDYIRNVI